ncbi:MAG: hypothetical protein RLZZ546_2359 [Bacteroidota bacterium]|jgi:outer membrane biosynthesis protein TonB
MKKVVLSLAFVAAVLVSCKDKNAEAPAADAAMTEAVDTAAAAVDTAAAAVDTAAASTEAAAEVKDAAAATEAAAKEVKEEVKK